MEDLVPVPYVAGDLSEAEVTRIVSAATEAAEFLKALGQESRLLILCYLLNGERSVTELEQFLGARQAAVSQQLARLRLQGLVRARRDGKAIYYSLTDDRPRRIIEVLYDMYCRDKGPC